MQILQALGSAGNGGAENFFSRLVPALQGAGIKQTAIVRIGSGRERDLEMAGIPVKKMRFGSVHDPVTRYRFNRAVRNVNPDILMTWMNRASGLSSSGRHVQIGRLGGYYNLKYYRRCKHLVGNSKGIVNYILSKGWPADRVHHISNFVDTAFESPAARNEFSTPENVKLLLALGRLHPDKAFDTLISALAKLPEDTWLWLAGDGGQAQNLRALASELGVEDRIRFMGWQQNVAALLATADVLVVPSRHEPLGNVVLEAWAHRVPLVATESEGPAELITDGETGLLVPVDDAQALATQIAFATSNREVTASMVNRAWENYQKNFGRDTIVARYRELFEHVLSR